MKRIINLIAAFLLVASAATAQRLSVANIDATPGSNTTIAVNISGATTMTALQFNLSLPAGVTLANNGGNYGISLGSSAGGHTLSVQPLASGDYLVVLYNMYLNTFSDGTLLTIPVSIGTPGGTTSGSLYDIYMSTAAAVSHQCANVSFNAISDVPVSGITLDRATATLVEGEKVTLTATVSPANASDKTVTWSSSNSTVATVTNGVVTAVAPGTATITAKAGDKTATCKVTVEKKIINVTSITLDRATATLVEGETTTLVATVSPANASDKTVTWSSSNSTVATVTNGVVTTVAPGTATITAKAGDKTATCKVTVEKKVIPVSGITLDRTTATLVEGEKVTLTATVSPANASDKTVTWSSSNSSIATVANGVVTAVVPGTATITAKAGDKTATCKVTVKKVEISIGDVNEDFAVTVSDIVAVVNYLLEKPTKVFNFAAADVNKDKAISIVDVVGVINIILNSVATIDNDYKAKRGVVSSNGDRMSISGVSSEDGNVSIPVSLENATAYTAFQMDVELPEGATLASATLGSRAASSHSVTWSNIADNKVRVVAYSLNNAAFKGATGELLTLDVQADGVNGTVSVDNIRMVTADGVENAIGGCGTTIDGNGTTGVNAASADAVVKVNGNSIVIVGAANSCVKVYSAGGALVESIDSYAGEEIILDKGVYIIRVGNKAVKVKL